MSHWQDDCFFAKEAMEIVQKLSIFATPWG